MADELGPGERRRMEDVARHAGVSQMTVSRALRTPDKVAPATRARIAAAIAELDYVPDLVAGGLAARRSRLVAVIVSTLENSIFAATVQGLDAALRDQGYAVLLGSSDYSREGEEELLRAVLGRRPDGIVLTDYVHTPAAQRLLRAAGIPVVETWELPAAPLDLAVGFSNLAAARAMTLDPSRLRLPADRVRRHRRSRRPTRAAAAGGLPRGAGRAGRRAAARGPPAGAVPASPTARPPSTRCSPPTPTRTPPSASSTRSRPGCCSPAPGSASPCRDGSRSPASATSTWRARPPSTSRPSGSRAARSVPRPAPCLLARMRGEPVARAGARRRLRGRAAGERLGRLGPFVQTDASGLFGAGCRPGLPAPAFIRCKMMSCGRAGFVGEDGALARAPGRPRRRAGAG